MHFTVKAILFLDSFSSKLLSVLLKYELINHYRKLMELKTLCYSETILRIILLKLLQVKNVKFLFYYVNV